MRHSPKQVYKWEDWVVWTWVLLPGSPHQSQPGRAALWCLCPQLLGQSLSVRKMRCGGEGWFWRHRDVSAEFGGDVCIVQGQFTKELKDLRGGQASKALSSPGRSPKKGLTRRGHSLRCLEALPGWQCLLAGLMSSCPTL